MSILIDHMTRVLVQGITGREGRFHTGSMLAYGTHIVAGVTPGKGGTFVEQVPVYDSVAEAARDTRIDASIVFVPAGFAVDALYEAVDAEIKLIVCITEGIPMQDMMGVCRYAVLKGTRLIGPNCPGVISPGRSKIGIMPGDIYTAGSIGIVSRSGTLTYEVVAALTQHGIGQSTCVGIGGDPIIGSSFVDILTLFEQDRETKAIVLIGEIGGTDEEAAARYVSSRVSKPVVAFIAGKGAPPERRMGHAGALIAAGGTTAEEKMQILREHGVLVVDRPNQIPEYLGKVIQLGVA